MVTTCNMDARANLEDALHRELELLLQEQRNQQFFGRERGVDMHRSGSAPPTVEGLLNAMGGQFVNSDSRGVNDVSCSSNNGLLSDDELRWHPAYLSYYYSNDQVNPRLPPPLLSKEDWRVARRFQSTGSSFDGVGCWRKKLVDGDDSSSSLFSVQPGIPVEQAEKDLMELRNASAMNHSRKMPVKWLDKGSEAFIGLAGTGFGPRRKSFADILQEGLDQNASLSSDTSRPASCNTFRDIRDPSNMSNLHTDRSCNGLEFNATFLSGEASAGFGGVQSCATAVPTFTVCSPLPRSKTPEAHLVGQSAVSILPPIGTRVGPLEKKNIVGSSVQNSDTLAATEASELAMTLSRLSMSEIGQAEDFYRQSQLQMGLDNPSDLLLNVANAHKQSFQQKVLDRTGPGSLSFSTNHDGLAKKNGNVTNLGNSVTGSQEHVNFPKRTSSSLNLYSSVDPSGLQSLDVSNVNFQNVLTNGMDFTGPGAHSVNRSGLPGDGHKPSLSRLANQLASSDFHSPIMDPKNLQHLQRSNYVTPAAAGSSDPPLFRNNNGTLHADLDKVQRECLALLLTQNKQQYDLSLLGNSGGLSHRFYGNPSYDTSIMYPGSHSVFPSTCPRSFQSERISRSTSALRGTMGGPLGSCQLDIGSAREGRYPPSLLDDFKNNKTRSLELSNIVGHVIEFSMDQYGSRFIQQKLETATLEEKKQIFPEILPHARTLMTDVFGNYVIQKFFEHGTESQRKELAGQLTGYILPLSLQMYGCRVIQKALEVVDADEQAQMVKELEGAVMKCVRDQNGNHVIQKCIECVPQGHIEFIISAFYGQVVALSTHPYGCRVIQRVLEHCGNAKTQEIIMDEIMQSVCTLAQDQYGNYVIQHVLEHGKPHERSAIITKLAGQIVKMSQQKFASNVVEKCLTFGGQQERQLLVNEMLGSTDDNEPLQVMMKDPFGNYVVQKVLEVCDDQSLELILSRIKVHLTALKRYTYGKHIVSRVEKLITTGERRIGLLSSLSLPNVSE